MDEEAALKALDQMVTAMGSVEPTVIHWITAAAFATQAAWVRERSPVPRPLKPRLLPPCHPQTRAASDTHCCARASESRAALEPRSWCD